MIALDAAGAVVTGRLAQIPNRPCAIKTRICNDNSVTVQRNGRFPGLTQALLGASVVSEGIGFGTAGFAISGRLLCVV
jgi:hypothetical protein